jgi:hypothetical protein
MPTPSMARSREGKCADGMAEYSFTLNAARQRRAGLEPPVSPPTSDAAWAMRAAAAAPVAVLAATTRLGVAGGRLYQR